MSSSWPSYTWDANARQYRGPDGRFVPRTAVRQALDEAIDQAALDVERHALDLQAGAINLPEWQLRTEKSIRAIHVMSTALACGGWAQATAADWALAGRRLREQYGYLYRFARQIEAGLPLDGRFVARAMMYANAGSGTYEAALRRRDLATGTVLRERRLLHSGHPCPSCIEYHALGWQPPGVLPDIGQQCECHSNCRCSFQRQFGAAGALPTVTIPPRTPPAAPAAPTPRPRPRPTPKPLVAAPPNPLPAPMFKPKPVPLPAVPLPEPLPPRPAVVARPAPAPPKPPAARPKPKAKPAPLPRKKAPITPARAAKPTGRPNPQKPAAKPPAPPEAAAHATYIDAEHAKAVAELAKAAGMTPEAYQRRIGQRFTEAVRGAQPYVRVNASALPKILEAGRFKTQFETGTSNGALDPFVRKHVEARVLGLPETTPDAQRPIYGYLSAPGFGSLDTLAEQRLDPYGDVAVRLKTSVKAKATITAGDSLAKADQVVGSPATAPSVSSLPLNGITWERDNRQLLQAPDGPTFLKAVQGTVGYVEAQYRGLSADDIAEVSFATQPPPDVARALDSRKIPWHVRKPRP